MNDAKPEGLTLAETILFMKMITFRYPYLRFRETKLGTVCWTCVSDPVHGLPEGWMLNYLYRNQQNLKTCLSYSSETKYQE